MPSLLTKRDLLQQVVHAANKSGWQVLYLSDAHPFRLHIYRDDTSYRVRVYIWNLTHGRGPARPVHEYRVQITGVNQFQQEPAGKTLILGWWGEADVFAGFDFRRHRSPLGESPSIQIHHDALVRAQANRFAAHRKENGELAVAFTPEFFVEYVRNLESLHDFGESESELEVLEDVAEDPAAVNDTVIERLPEPRRESVRSIRTRLRAASFQTRVLTAYQHRCAFCGLQLDLVHAGHIVPVSYEGSTDETCNGLAVCALHHSAYDGALITTDSEYRVLANLSRLRYLETIGHDEGRDAFLRALRPRIILPVVISDRPRTQYIDVANQARGWREAESYVLEEAS